jgi:hypothetical protein
VDFGKSMGFGAGELSLCSIREDAMLTCVGDATELGSYAPPLGPFSAVDLGTGGCALLDDGSADCWGSFLDIRDQVPVDARFLQISVGWGIACGITIDGHTRCWGDETLAIDVPDEPFVQISAGASHVCAIRPNGTVGCWATPISPDDYGRAIPPAGTFAQVSASVVHTCGIRSDRTVACWGAGKTLQSDCSGSGNLIDHCGMAIAPQGTFDEVATGVYHTCGIRTTGEVTCWGTSPGGALTPPADFR